MGSRRRASVYGLRLEFILNAREPEKALDRDGFGLRRCGFFGCMRVQADQVPGRFLGQCFTTSLFAGFSSLLMGVSEILMFPAAP